MTELELIKITIICVWKYFTMYQLFGIKKHKTEWLYSRFGLHEPG